MKAREYYETYRDGLISGEQTYHQMDTVRALFLDMSLEAQELMKARQVKTADGVSSVIKEQNQKWNAIVRLLEKKDGITYYKRNGFQEYIQAVLNRHTEEKENEEAAAN